MANYNMDRYNDFLLNAQDIYEYLSGEYMNQYEGCLLDCGPLDDSVGSMKIVEIFKYRKMENDEATFNTFKSTIYNALSSFHRNQCAVGYFLVSNQGNIKLYFASEVIGGKSFESVLQSGVPDALIRFGTFVSKTELGRLARYGGVVTGAVDLDRNIVDSVLDELKKEDSVIGLIARPCSRPSSLKYSEALNELLELASAFDSVNESSGNASRVNINRQFPGTDLLKNFITNENSRISLNQNDFWTSCIWFGSSSAEHSVSLGAALAGALTSADVGKVDKGRFYLTTDNPLRNGNIAFSRAHYDSLNYNIATDLLKSGLVSTVTTQELSGMFQLPSRSHIGLTVTDANVGFNSITPFDTNVPSVDGDSLVLGEEVVTKQLYRLPLRYFTQHVLVTGMTGGGKTNTVLLLLENISAHRIPFCVIEASKKEYWRMIGNVPNLQVFSCGNDAIPLRLNPLEPEDGIIISKHIDEIMYAFTGAFEMEEPTRLSLLGLIKYTFQKLGWSLHELAYKQEKRYPTIQDLLDNLQEFSTIGIRSGEEVTRNIEGSILRRLESMAEGTEGQILNVRTGVSGKELCSNSVLVELDDLALSVKPFITNILLVRVNQYLRQGDVTHSLKNVILLEEAHNVFSELSKSGIETSKDIASNYFSRLLSEIRSFGTGMIISDQGAAQINSQAVANTKIKIVHALAREEDADAEAFALRLSPFQKTRLPELKTGEAIVSVLGETNVCKVKVRPNSILKIRNYACLFCNYRKFCELETVKRKIDADGRGMLLLAKVYNNRFNGGAIRNDVDLYLDSLGLSDNLKMCAFGYMLANSTMECGEQEKRRILYRYWEQ